MASLLRVDGIQNTNNSNLITQANATTITIGTTGQTISLASGASSSGFGATYNGALNWTSNLVTSALSVSAGVGYFVNTSSAAITLTLPSSPTVGSSIGIVDYSGYSSTNNITLDPNGNKITGSLLNKKIQTNKEAITLTYSDSTIGWVVSSASLEGTLGLVGVPGAPTIGTATAVTFSSATVTYTAPTDNGGSTITTYTATSSPGNITGTVSQAGSGTITVSGLSGSTNYTFTVTATNSVGTSSASAASNQIIYQSQG